jgi:hypothetical protein
VFRNHLAVAVAAILCAEPLAAATREVIKTDWNRFQEEVSLGKLAGRSVLIRLSGGGEIKTKLLYVTDAALLVRATRSTRQWNPADGRAQIPKDKVASVRFTGRTGHGGLIGGLAGSGVGAGVGAAIANSIDVYEGPAVVVPPIAAAGTAILGGLAGFFIGRHMGREAPEFILTR